jgi:trk system potassium uptake protein TrkH
MDFEVALFEVVSALGTVGLSIGGTVSLDAVGKLVIAVTMLLGRTGPLTLALLLGRSAPSRVLRPEARIMVG